MVAFVTVRVYRICLWNRVSALNMLVVGILVLLKT